MLSIFSWSVPRNSAPPISSKIQTPDSLNSAMLSALQNIVDHNQKAKETKLEALANPCPFCNKRLAKYVCPQCKRGYCGVDCFRSPAHEECSEEFYKAQVKGEMGGIRGDEEEKEQMMEMLRRQGFEAPEQGGGLKIMGDPEVHVEGIDGDEMHEEDEDDDGEAGDPLKEGAEEDGAEEDSDEEDEEARRRRKDLEIRMTGLNIEEADFEEIWERLDPREREEFVLLAQELEKEENQATKLQG